MGLPNKDEIEGKFDQAKGKTKETVGRAINDRELENEGKADNLGGKVQEGAGHVDVASADWASVFDLSSSRGNR